MDPWVPRATPTVTWRTVDAVIDGLALRSGTGRAALAATVAASGMASLDATVVNLALPQIGEDLGAGISGVQWVLTSYLVALASLILLAGALGDRYGRRRVFLVGTVWFTAASVLCGVAPSLEVLVLARVLQGIGGALLTPGSLAILQASFRPADRGAAIAAWAGLGAVAGGVGPFVGGIVVDGPGWRWAFLVNVPIAVVVVACTRVAIPETRATSGSRPIDVVGAALAIATLATGTWALSESGRPGADGRVVTVTGAVAVVAAGAFVWRMTHTRDPLVPPVLFRDRVFAVVSIVTVLLYGALGAASFLIAYQLQVGAGRSALEASVVLLPSAVFLFLLSGRAGSLGERLGPRSQLSVGPVVVAGGLLLLSRVGTDPSWLTGLLPGASLLGLGFALLVAPLTAAVMSAADPDRVSLASGVNNALARTAALTAIAVIPVVSGLTGAVGVAEMTHAYRISMLLAATAAVAAAAVAFVGLRPDGRRDGAGTVAPRVKTREVDGRKPTTGARR